MRQHLKFIKYSCPSSFFDARMAPMFAHCPVSRLKTTTPIEAGMVAHAYTFTTTTKITG